MNMFGRLFRRAPKNLPDVETTVYRRGTRWFPYNPIKWVDLGYSVRTANQIYKLARMIADTRNMDIIQPRDPSLPAAPIPHEEDSKRFVDYLVSEEIITIAESVKKPKEE